MAETSVENRVCQSCGADVRPNTLFCYNCGESLAPKLSTGAKDEKNVSNAWFRENISEEKNGDKLSENKPAATIEATDRPIPKPPLTDEPKLKSAAAMRRQSKAYQPKRVEIIWEEYDAPNGWFILATILIALFAVGILFLAIYLK